MQQSKRRIAAAIGTVAAATLVAGGTYAGYRSVSTTDTQSVAAHSSQPPQRPVAVPAPHPATTPPYSPHFDTPEAAMRYLAAAWNANNLRDLSHVTDPAAREQLNAMHSEATHLALDHCDKRPAGDYDCFFTHEFPNAKVRQREDKDGDGIGHAEFLVGPADRPGWYMTVYVSCGG